MPGEDNQRGALDKYLGLGSDAVVGAAGALAALGLGPGAGVVAAGAGPFVNGQVHTNGIENFWSVLKRGLHGTYVSVEPLHPFRYLDERVFTFNHRAAADLARFSRRV